MQSLTNIPSSVYRIQLSSSFPFKKLIQILPYLDQLGIEGIYLSPIFESFQYGYDVSDPNKIAENLGGEKGFQELCKIAKKYQLKLILDIVPNHMGIQGQKNTWWMSVLKEGKNSPYAKFFDIRWKEGKVILPILHDPHQKCKVKKHSKLIQSKDTNGNINYRRFFNINELIGISIEKKDVFDKVHELTKKLVKQKLVQGLRVDHPDGIKDPERYFKRLKTFKPAFIWAEKILSPGEKVPASWGIDGTVGYDFLNLINGLFVEKANEKKMTTLYESFIGRKIDVDKLEIERKKRFIHVNLKSEVDFLIKILKNSDGMREALTDFMASFSVYRTYIQKGSISSFDQERVKEAIFKAKRLGAKLSCLKGIEKAMFHEPKFFLPLQQILPGVMAKGYEDSVLYNYSRLLSLNEVGGDVTLFGSSPKEFHKWNQMSSLSALASSTHDSKYSEDARYRLSALSEIPETFKKKVFYWKRINQEFKRGLDLNTEYYIYQMLLSVWPLEKTRLINTLRKAIREAGIYTSWEKIDLPYEKACMDFLNQILKSEPFLKSFLPFQKKLEKLGEKNSLAALSLKIGSKGIFDLYQGCENMRFSLVDPDNRREVSFKKISQAKFRFTQKGLLFRKEHKELFLKGKYTPLKSSKNIVAFIREHKSHAALFVIRRFFSKPLGEAYFMLPKKYLNKTFSDLMDGNKKSFLHQKVLATDFLKSSASKILSH